MKITIPQHEREINEAGWECVAGQRRVQNGEYWLTVHGSVQLWECDGQSVDRYPILRRAELTGWDWVKTLEPDTWIKTKSGDSFWVVENDSGRRRLHGLNGFIDFCDDPRLKISLSPSTCEVLYPKEGE